jgi:FAD/FMN-containing dehydrogenase/Fe-S oxidoreductase
MAVGVTGGLDVRGLEGDLASALRGEVRFDDGSRGAYAHDASNYRQVPIGVVLPRDAEDAIKAVEACRARGAPLLPRGGGTSLAGQCCNVAVVMDLSKYMHRVLEVDRERRVARAQPGTVLDDVRHAAELGDPPLTFGPDPSTHDRCTVGGMAGNNSCGTHSVMAEFYGPGPRMAHNVESMEVVTYDGLRLRVGRTSDEELDRIIREGGRRSEIYAALRDLRDRYADVIRERFPRIQRRVSGYNLDELLPENGFNVAGALIGTEGTCVTVLEATLRLIDSPPKRTVLVVAFEDVFRAADAVPAIRAHRPIALEGFDDVLVENNHALGMNEKALAHLPEGRGWLLVEFGGQTVEEADEKAERLKGALRKAAGFLEARIYDDPEAEEEMWEVRESGLGATAFVPGKDDAWEGWEDSAVPPESLGSYLRRLRELLDRYGYQTSLYGHYGQGCVHCRINFDISTAEGIATYRRFVDQAADLVLEHRGSLSGEHGDGQSRGELLPKMYGPQLVQAFREFKAIWDPDGRMNPGKVVDPYPLTSNLKLGTGYAPPQVETHFSYPEDHGDFAHATLRCVGVGKCRAFGDTMCPSYMVTREEEHSTRGRARLLFEMMRGREIELWKSDEVFDALELCLACKGCKTECPVNVDMATYKAEFLSHYYRRRLRPRAAYALGLIYWWSRIASRIPGVANFVAHAPVLSTALKRAGGVAVEREAPRFASTTFKTWFRGRGRRRSGGPAVLVWPDTFNNYFHPGTARATVEVLEAAGYRVVVPQPSLCCGRPLYDYGMLDLAERLLRQILDTLRPYIRAGVPVIGIEPSCLAVFKDELPNLFPKDHDALRLARQSYMLSEFLMHEGWEPPRLQRKAVVHGHCHHKTVLGFEDEEQLLEKMGLDAEILDSGCCGMAGSFGFEAGEKYEVGRAAGERVLLPAVRRAADDTLLVTDGFSCRSMIEQETDRRALHIAEVIRMALDRGPEGPRGIRPEETVEEGEASPDGRPAARNLLPVGAALAAAAGLAWALRARRPKA